MPLVLLSIIPSLVVYTVFNPCVLGNCLELAVRPTRITPTAALDPRGLLRSEVLKPGDRDAFLDIPQRSFVFRSPVGYLG